MRSYKILIIAVFFALAVSGCYTPTTSETNIKKTTNPSETKTEDTNNNPETKPEGNTENKPANNTEKVETVDAPKPGMSPTEVLKAFSRANQTKDVEKIKSFLSKGSIAEIEASAKRQNTTVAELLTKGAEEDPIDPEIRNEKINGDKATVEVKNEVFKRFDEMPFVKEDGVWKIALDTFMENMLKKINEDQRQAPVGPTGK